MLNKDLNALKNLIFISKYPSEVLGFYEKKSEINKNVSMIIKNMYLVNQDAMLLLYGSI
jgi:hypothetical protein